MQYRPDLDGLRAVAVTLVVLYHATFPAPGGFLGVDVFFTLSGFLITTQVSAALAADTFSLRTFYIKRSLRLLPAATVAVSCTLFTALALLPREAVEQTATSSVAALWSLSNVRYLLQAGYFDASAKFKPLLHTWSLAVEEQFYLFWPPLLVLFHRHLGTNSAPLFAVLAVIVSPFVSSYLLVKHPAAAFYLAPARFYELLLGAALSYLPPSSSQIERNALGALGLVALAAAIVFISSADPFPGWRALVPCMATAALIRAGPNAAVSRVLAWGPLTFIGKISYSVYLVHWPVVVVYRIVAGQQGDFEVGEMVFMVGSAFVLGFGLNVLVEKRFRIMPGGGGAAWGAHTNRNKGSVLCEEEEKEEKEGESFFKEEGKEGWNGSGDVKLVEKREPKINDGAALRCWRLFVVTACLQALFIMIAYSVSVGKGAGRLVQATPNSELLSIPATVDGTPTRDDYNGLDLASVRQLDQECGASRAGVLRAPIDETSKNAMVYENGTKPVEGRAATMPKILVLGDSHAGHWACLAYALSRTFEAHVELWRESGCAPLINVRTVFRKSPASTARCAKLMGGLEAALRRRNFDTVLLSARWSPNAHGDVYGDRRLRSAVLVKSAADDGRVKGRPTEEEFAALYNESRVLLQRGLLETTQMIRGTGSRVVLFNQVPHVGDQPAGCTEAAGAAAAIAAGQQPERCGSASRAQALARLGFVGGAMREVQGEVDGVDVVMPGQFFCDNAKQDAVRCRVTLDGELLYIDSTHLSRLGAAFFVKRWEQVGWGGVPWGFRRDAK